MSKTVLGFDGQECERTSCDPPCGGYNAHLCDMGYNFEDGNSFSVDFCNKHNQIHFTGCPNPKECRYGTGYDMATDSEFPCASVCPTVCGPNQMSCDTTDEYGKLEHSWEMAEYL